MFSAKTGQHWKIYLWRPGSTSRYVYHRNGSTLKNPILKTWIYLQVCLPQKRVNTEKSHFEDMDLPSGMFGTETGQHWKIYFWRHGPTFRCTFATKTGQHWKIHVWTHGTTFSCMFAAATLQTWKIFVVAFTCGKHTNTCHALHEIADSGVSQSMLNVSAAFVYGGTYVVNAACVLWFCMRILISIISRFPMIL